MRRSYKFRMYPNVTQTRLLAEMLETHRRLYNECLAQRKFHWQVLGIGVSFYEQRSWFIRTWRDHRFYSRLNANSAHTTIERLDKAFQAFFRRVKAGDKPGYPRFKGRDRFDSVAFGTYPNGLKVLGSKIRVTHVGDIRCKLHRDIQGKIKTATLKREAGKWYVVFSCELPDAVIEPSVNPPVGIDVGLESFLATSDGEHEQNPKYLKTSLQSLRRKQRQLCRKKRGGTNRRKAVKRVARLHARIKNLRKEHHHQTALKLVRRYGLIAVESLNIRGMVRNGRLSRAITDAAWGGFVSILKCKAESAGVKVVEVDPNGTSQECSGCGRDVPKELSVRVHRCPHCGLELHRDHNSARVILARAQARIGPAGGNGSDGSRRQRSSAVAPVRSSTYRKRKAVKPLAIVVLDSGGQSVEDT